MAADTLVTFGDTRLSHRFEANQQDVHGRRRGGQSIIAVAGTAAHFPVLQHALAAHAARGAALRQQGRGLRTFTQLHPVLKDTSSCRPRKTSTTRTSRASSRVLLANASGIYGIYSYREVFEFKEFWGIGSGRSFALGAMHAAYDKARRRAKWPRPASPPACEFDRNSAGPVDVSHTQTEGVQMSEATSQSAGHRRLRRSRGDRGAGEGRRHGQGRAVADHGRDRTRPRWRFRRRMPAW